VIESHDAKFNGLMIAPETRNILDCIELWSSYWFVRRPDNENPLSVAMFFGCVHSPPGRQLAAGLILNSDGGFLILPRLERSEYQLPISAQPGLD
jgi:hypothetical protein